MVLNKSHEILLMTKGHKIPLEIQHKKKDSFARYAKKNKKLFTVIFKKKIRNKNNFTNSENFPNDLEFIFKIYEPCIYFIEISSIYVQ